MIVPEDIAEIFPLSPLQEGMLFHQLLQSDSDGERAYGNQMVLRLRGKVDPDLLEQSWNELIARHDALRTIFRATGAERPVQLVLRKWPFRLVRHDLSKLPGQERGPAVDAIIADLRRKPFDLAHEVALRLTLVRTADDEALLVWDFHHILMDGWCIGLLQDQLSDIYHAYSTGKKPPRKIAPSYGRFVSWVERRRKEPARDYWRRTLSGYDGHCTYPGQRRENFGPRHTALREICFDKTLSDGICACAAGAGVTVRTVVEALWSIILAEFNRRDDVLFGTVAGLRFPELGDSEQIVGLCINTVPRRIGLRRDEAFDVLILRLQSEQSEWFESAHLPLSEIQTLEGCRAARFDHLLAFENYPRSRSSRPDTAIESLDDSVTIEQVGIFEPSTLDFTLLVFPGERLKFVAKFNSGIMSATQTENILERLETLARQVVDNPGLPVGHLISADQGGHRSTEFEDSKTSSSSRERNVLAWRRDIVARTGQNPALRFGGSVYSQSELQRRSESLAQYLTGQFGVMAGRPVILLANASDNIVIAMLACMYLGTPFVPLEITTPGKRIARIANDCSAAVLLCDDVLVPDGLPPCTITVGLNAALRASATMQQVSALPDRGADPDAYIIYTSGTTGAPKGVRVGQRSLLNYVAWLHRSFDIGPDDRSAVLTSLSYDLGYTALFGCLLLGGTVTILSEDERRDPARILETLEDHRLTFLKTTPSQLHLLVEAPESDRFSVPDLRLVLAGGEEQRFSDLRKLKAINPRLRLINHYGPTEATIGCIAGEIDDQLLREADPPQRIGRPVSGVRVLICDEMLHPVAPGVAGEILVGGRSLAKGYINAGAADAARFVVLAEFGGECFYRTGDHGYALPDGQIAFLGRSDDQTKIRGYRVALREVEAAIRELPGIKDAAVAVSRNADGDADLVAVVVSSASGSSSPQSLRQQLQGVLPQAMIPSVFIPVSRLPVTSNGKLDRAALLAGVTTAGSPAKSEPGTPVEEKLRAIWSAVLFRENIGLEDNFFELGGHSIKAIQIISRIRAALGVRLAVRSLFDHPTIRSLASAIAQRSAAAAGATRLVRLSETQVGPAWFWLPSLLGTSTVYREFSSQLPVRSLGLQCPGFDCDEPFATDLPALVSQFITAVRSTAGEGPYVLAGWSFGGMLALETARQFEASGASVKVILFDTELDSSMAEPVVASLSEMAVLPAWRGVLTEITGHLPAEHLARLDRLLSHNLSLSGRFARTPGLKAELYCFEATGNPRPIGMTQLRKITSGHVHVELVGGNHYSMFQPPHVADLIERVRGIIPFVSA